MPLPVATPQQRQEALDKARKARIARAEALGRVRDGTVTLAAVLADEDSPLQRVPVRRVLLAIPRVGTATADTVMEEIGINVKRRLAGLGPRQRQALAERFP